ncbi:MAG: hypothetical protein NWF05_07110, partial [Candidatus Bathyarchaeota archaeon]|nr:hypothetical protein [Candidatus Bathyarchaeota archaeon]
VSITEEVAAVEEAPVEIAPVMEEPAAIEAPEFVAEAPAIEFPVEEPAAVEEPAVMEAAVEEPVAEAFPTETIPEAPIAEEPAFPEPEPAVVAETPQKSPLDEFEVAEPDVVQQELLQEVEEIAENPFQEAPIAAQEEAAVDIPAEVSEPPQVQIHIAKESLPDASSSEDETETPQ